MQLLRKKNGLSQEQLADKLGVSRQTIGKWENGQAIPELPNILQISDLYGVTIDRIVKEDDECNIRFTSKEGVDIKRTIAFLIKAKLRTYAGHGPEIVSSRVASHDLEYKEEDLFYYDTYLGGECFSGEEAIWHHGIPVWCMNYSGRVVGENFNGDFLKEVLSHVPKEMPYRGPAIYKKGDYSYHCKVDGEFIWYQGYEEIFYCDEKIYECYFHGGIVK
ncbi:MAG: helix-turn-helix transcriptional regulator [Clostridiales bacterium]|nr:helix-turn-helix transcriptional regulator [Clostridiales bacterium]